MTAHHPWRPSPRFGRAYYDAYGKVKQDAERAGAPLAARAILYTSLAVVLALGVYIYFTRDIPLAAGSQSVAQPDAQAYGTVAPLVTMEAEKVVVTPSPKPNQAEADALDLTGGAIPVLASNENMNLPGIDYGELLYSAGTGTARLPVLKDLYLYDMETQTETKVAEASVKNGEIYETQLSQRWIVFIDTNQNGDNQICYIDRFSESKEVMLVRETKYALPKLRLYDDYLVWIEQTEQGTDDVWFFKLGSDDNFPVTTLTDAATYGVSAPSIHGNEIIWAAPDPEQSQGEAETDGKSAIYVCDIDELSGDNVVYEYFCAGMYVHDPLTNGEVWAWIDKNWAPDNGLYLKYRNGSNVIKVSEGVTSYALGDGILVYAKDMQVWAYFYEKNVYARLTEPGMGMQPVVSGRYVAWYDLSGDT